MLSIQLFHLFCQTFPLRISFLPICQCIGKTCKKAIGIMFGCSGFCSIRTFQNSPVTALDTQQIYKCDLAFFPVRTNGFSELIGCADYIQQIIPNLERHPQPISVLLRRVKQRLSPAGSSYAQSAGSGDHGAGLQAVDLRQFLLC